MASRLVADPKVPTGALRLGASLADCLLIGAGCAGAALSDPLGYVYVAVGLTSGLLRRSLSQIS